MDRDTGMTQGIRKDVQECLRHEEWEQDVHQITLELPQDVKDIQGHILNIVQSTPLGLSGRAFSWSPVEFGASAVCPPKTLNPQEP